MSECTSDDHDCYPQYGVGPHRHDLSRGTFLGSTVPLPKEDWPNNFREDPEVPGCGVWLCPGCLEDK